MREFLQTGTHTWHTAELGAAVRMEVTGPEPPGSGMGAGELYADWKCSRKSGPPAGRNTEREGRRQKELTKLFLFAQASAYL